MQRFRSAGNVPVQFAGNVIFQLLQETVHFVALARVQLAGMLEIIVVYDFGGRHLRCWQRDGFAFQLHSLFDEVSAELVDCFLQVFLNEQGLIAVRARDDGGIGDVRASSVSVFARSTLFHRR